MEIDFLLLGNLIMFVIAFFKVIKNTDENGNILIVLIYLEILLLASTVIFLISSLNLNDIIGQTFAFIILAIAAAESAIALALVIAFYKQTGSVSFKNLNALRG